jgi:hypothetical protein
MQTAAREERAINDAAKRLSHFVHLSLFFLLCEFE